MTRSERGSLVSSWGLAVAAFVLVATGCSKEALQSFSVDAAATDALGTNTGTANGGSNSTNPLPGTGGMFDGTGGNGGSFAAAGGRMATASIDAPVDSPVAAMIPATGLQCGKANQACCRGGACESGGCCIAGRCVEAGGVCTSLPVGGGAAPWLCADGTCKQGAVSCGGAGQTCCASPAVVGACTASYTRCSGFGPTAICGPCGEAGQACCQGTQQDPAPTCKGSGFACRDGVCATCGMPGQPCCAGNSCGAGGCCVGTQGSAITVCVASAGSCGGGGTCTAGRCAGCGGKGQACCTGVCQEPNSRCSAGLGTTAGVCGGCGGGGETCCLGGADVACQTGFACSQGSNICARCGGETEVCCPGETCSDGGCCAAGRCIGKGKMCQSNGLSFGLCTGGQCECGKAGQSCCPVSAATPAPCSELGTGCVERRSPDGSKRMCEKCGGPNEPCCINSAGPTPVVCREAGYACTRGLNFDDVSTCRKCGELGGPCCALGAATPRCAAADAVCNIDNLCQKCGTANGPCCAGSKCDGTACCSGNRCVSDGLICSGSNYGTCTAGVCACGKDGQGCCYPGIACTDPGTTCSGSPGNLGSKCRKCGEPGGPCCPGFGCTGGCCVRTDLGVFSCAAATAVCGNAAGTTACDATSGSCGTCGGVGQPCCVSKDFGGRFCSAAGAYCDVGGAVPTCGRCGGKNELCCSTNSSFRAGQSPTGSCTGGLLCRFSSGGDAGFAYFCQ